MHETTKGHTDNHPIKSTQPRPDIIGTKMADNVCADFLFVVRPCGATLRVHQDVNNGENQKKKTIKLRNIRFYKSNHTSQHDQDKEDVDWVNINF